MQSIPMVVTIGRERGIEGLSPKNTISLPKATTVDTHYIDIII